MKHKYETLAIVKRLFNDNERVLRNIPKAWTKGFLLGDLKKDLNEASLALYTAQRRLVIHIDLEKKRKKGKRK